MEVEIIKANSSGEDISNGRRIDRLRVAAYCRVSTDDEDQIKSYNSMVRYYTDLIKSNKQWVFAGVFADKAITGTKTDKREEFQLLIQECLSGNIDLVIAKSIPRFARNTLDTLKYVRMLRERNIAVYFEVEKINTLKDGEFLLTILSSVAQQEVENTSAYVKKGLKMKMKRGELVGFQGCLGYDYDVVTKSLSINEEGAETVRYIFDRYVAGAGSTMIARELNEQGISTIKGNLWTSSSVMGIINNEKYKGDILLGKTFTVDPISKRRLGNLGEEDRFYIKNHHEPIISEEKFARAQEIRERRNGGRKKGVAPGKREKLQSHMHFLLSKGGLYKVYNNNLLYHGCIPLNEDGSFKSVKIYGRSYKGKALYEVLESYVRKGFYAIDEKERKRGKDMMWYIWLSENSPLFGKDKMATFERYFLAEKETHKEKKNPYYDFLENDKVVDRILKEFGLEHSFSHIINGHMPVKSKNGENPMKCGGKVFVIDGGFSRAYQKQTGIAGYTLIYNSYGMILSAHEPFESKESAIENETDIHSDTIVTEIVSKRQSVLDTDVGKELVEQIHDLEFLLEAYRSGRIAERL